ncbi:hypothetical protein PENSPDRAFT_628182 [Peniophora sp. CONT]|nr:hypothetical protein PENSPDRAFT_628182 [Peniophora sp. CONT]
MSDYSDEEYFDEDEDMLEDESADTDPEDEMDIDGLGGSMMIESSKGKKKSYEVDYSDLGPEELERLMKADLVKVADICQISNDAAALLLRHMRWKTEPTIEAYMDNPTKLSVSAGLTPAPSLPAKQSTSIFGSRTTRSTPKKAASPPPEDNAVCQICFDDEATETLSLDCGHAFCTGCWAAYATSKIREEGEHKIPCMAEGCSVLAPDTFVLTVLSPTDARAAARFKELCTRDYVEAQRALKFCPYPECTHAVRCSAAATKASLSTIVPAVTCGADAKHQFCFGCNIEADHRPLLCAVSKLWLQKCRDDSETANWIKSNTKECSKCQSTIEKNGGCNHMTCKKCKHEFCWVCMGSWQEHGTQWYNCNRFDEKSGLEARDAQSRSRASLERYLHYYNRWANHEQSAKLSVELYAKTEKKMEEVQANTALTWIEVQFLRKAVDEVVRCRTTLKWTYAMAYYLSKGNEKEMFEDNQRDLERAVEDLSELLEMPLEPEGIPALRQKVTDKAVYVSRRNEIMLEDTANGYTDGRWKWNAKIEGLDEDMFGEAAY